MFPHDCMPIAVVQTAKLPINYDANAPVQRQRKRTKTTNAKPNDTAHTCIEIAQQTEKFDDDDNFFSGMMEIAIHLKKMEFHVMEMQTTLLPQGRSGTTFESAPKKRMRCSLISRIQRKPPLS